jgi:hypothetical protein
MFENSAKKRGNGCLRSVRSRTGRNNSCARAIIPPEEHWLSQSLTKFGHLSWRPAEREMRTKFRYGKLKEREHMQDLGVDGRIT